MGYSRTKAIDYAKTFWDRPCDDGVFWLTEREVSIAHMRKQLRAPVADGWDARFIPHYDAATNSASEDIAFIKSNRSGQSIPRLPGTWDLIQIHGWAGLADCAHYLSKCLQAGGANVSSLRVAELVAKLQAMSDTITLAEKVSKAQAQRVIDTGWFKPGDMIGYFNISPHGDYGRANSYTHSTMFVGKIDTGGNPDSKDSGRITCHSNSRFGHQYWDEEWWLHDTYTYTLIHFKSDDPPR